MPSKRSDLFVAVEKILKQAGVTTVWRGPFFPKDHGDVPEDCYPIAGYMDAPNGERIESGNIGFRFLGEVECWIWVSTGRTAGPLEENPGSQEVLDDLHDAIMDQLSDAYRGEQTGGILTSQISLFPAPDTSWEPGWYSLDTAHIGAKLSLRYEINYAPKAH
jgi:hypothetical protein